tara:strand:+ start:20 stop:1024 length:1005 start_codon:yes stop_codon:yes gene_type:complete
MFHPDFPHHQCSSIDKQAAALAALAPIKSTDFIFLQPFSIGDNIHSLSLMRAFRQRYCQEGQKIFYICLPHSVSIVSLFGCIDHVVGLAQLKHMDLLLEAFSSKYISAGPGYPIVLSPNHYCNGWLGRLVHNRKITPIDCRKLILGLDFDSDLPVFPDLALRFGYSEQLHRASKLIQAPKSSIIIFNHARSIQPVPPSWFKLLQKYFGYNIYYDAQHGTNEVLNQFAHPIKIPLCDIPVFADYAGHVISLRSGITDLLGFGTSKVLSIYPNHKMCPDVVGTPQQLASCYRSLTHNNLGYGTTREFPIFLDQCPNQETSEHYFARQLHSYFTSSG